MYVGLQANQPRSEKGPYESLILASNLLKLSLC